MKCKNWSLVSKDGTRHLRISMVAMWKYGSSCGNFSFAMHWNLSSFRMTCRLSVIPCFKTSPVCCTHASKALIKLLRHSLRVVGNVLRGTSTSPLQCLETNTRIVGPHHHKIFIPCLAASSEKCIIHQTDIISRTTKGPPHKRKTRFHPYKQMKSVPLSFTFNTGVYDADYVSCREKAEAALERAINKLAACRRLVLAINRIEP